MAEDKKTIKLKFPFTVKTERGADVEVKELTMRRMKVKDLDLMPDSIGAGVKPKEFVPLIAALSGHNIDTIGELDFEDLNAVAKAIASFYPDSLGKIGGKLSGESPQPTDSLPETSGT